MAVIRSRKQQPLLLLLLPLLLLLLMTVLLFAIVSAASAKSWFSSHTTTNATTIDVAVNENAAQQLQLLWYEDLFSLPATGANNRLSSHWCMPAKSSVLNVFSY